MLFKVLWTEWSLVFFTLFAQSAIGLSIIYTLLVYLKKIHQENYIEKYVIVFASLMTVGLIFSITHLSNPFNGFYILKRLLFTVNDKLQIGWLPLEVISLGSSVLLAAIIYYYRQKEDKNILVHKLLLLLPILSFIGLIFMTGLYASMNKSVPIWDVLFTFLTFLTSSFFLGSLVIIGIFSFESKLISKVMLGSFIAFLLVLGLNLLRLSSLEITGVENVFALAYGYYGLILFTGLLLTISPVIFIIYKTFKLQIALSKAETLIAIIVIFLGMVAIRSLFYSIINTQIFL